ncbi:MAG: hypothetical protein RLZZ506_1190 [Bacteroidota bacterium]
MEHVNHEGFLPYSHKNARPETLKATDISEENQQECYKKGAVKSPKVFVVEMREITVVNKGHDPTNEIEKQPHPNQVAVNIFVLEPRAMNTEVVTKTRTQKNKANPREN